EVADRRVRQITYGAGTCDMEPCYLPSGDIIFTSTRCDQAAACWWTTVMNLYICDGEGRYIRRLGFDQDHTIQPQILQDGRIVYTRWEYNDRSSGVAQTTFMMNPDGTNQTEHYGNNSYMPVSLFHVRGIPDSSKQVGIMCGHHVDQHGKLVMIDRSKGTQENQGLAYICPKKNVTFIKHVFGKTLYSDVEWADYSGEQFQYPWALNEENYLVGYLPWYQRHDWARGPYPVKFGIYWMNINGERELLVYDPTIASCQQFPLAARNIPQIKPTAVDQNRNDGTFYVQDVYFGPGMEGVERGTAKKLRVVGIEPRAVATTYLIHYPAGAQCTTPIAINNGSWDVKHVLGEVDVEEDGSAYFTVPARTPVYFQLLNEKGHVIQTMRSWAVLQPGETMSCVGCHEDKNSSIISGSHVTQASRKAPQKIVPFFKEGEKPVQEQVHFFTENQKQAYEYLSIQAPQGEDVPRGFSYRREIQPILDKHCIVCHTGTKNPDKPDAPFSLLGDSKEYNLKAALGEKGVKFVGYKEGQYNIGDQIIGRDFSESYLNLTKHGRVGRYADLRQNAPPSEFTEVPYDNWIVALHASSSAQMIKPYSFGSSQSGLMNYLESSHYNVQLTDNEKRCIACWIDICIPYCGSYMEANTWDGLKCNYMHRYQDQLRAVYLYHEAKRLHHAMVEVDHLNKYKEYLATGQNFLPGEFARMDFGGTKIQKEFIDHFNVKHQQVPIHGIAAGHDSRGGTTVAENPFRNLAVNPSAATHQIRSYPHATSNSHHKYRAEFSPKNLIDGNKSPDNPFWQPDPRTDLWVKVELGREVSVEKTIIYLKKFPDSQKTWTSATLVFSDGSKVPID
ncbi:MAG: hypothetical protein LBC02_02340, partial [Planctomycetaceae bacterium]|nr:hypothetical protein [Planctomycetaceae bacterium]